MACSSGNATNTKLLLIFANKINSNALKLLWLHGNESWRNSCFWHTPKFHALLFWWFQKAYIGCRCGDEKIWAEGHSNGRGAQINLLKISFRILKKKERHLGFGLGSRLRLGECFAQEKQWQRQCLLHISTLHSPLLHRSHPLPSLQPLAFIDSPSPALLCTATAFRFQSRSSLKRNKNRQNNTRNEFTLPIHKILPRVSLEIRPGFIEK